MNYTVDWTTAHAADWLKALGHLRGSTAHGIEIGCFEGRSSVWFMEHILVQPQSTLMCVDPWADDQIHRRFLGNIAEAKVAERIEVRRCSSRDLAIPPSGHFFDFAYIDGSHVSRDLLLDAFKLWPTLKTGAVVIFDDYLWPAAEKSRLPHHLLPSFGIEIFCVVMGVAFKVTHRGTQVIGIKMAP